MELQPLVLLCQHDKSLKLHWGIKISGCFCFTRDTWQVASILAATCRWLCCHAWLLLWGLMWRRVCQAAHLICACVAGAQAYRSSSGGGLCLAISEMRKKQTIENLLFTVCCWFFYVVNKTAQINFSITNKGRRRAEEKQQQPNLGQEKAKFNACSTACFSSSSKLDEKN